MELFLFYLLRASILMVLFYGLYKIFFSKNTSHNVNRYLLILMLLMVTVLPLFRFNLIPEEKKEPVTETFLIDYSTLPATEWAEAGQKMEIPWVQILIILFAVGFLFTFTRYLIGVAQVIAIIRKSEKQELADHSILCVTEKNISPFSWMKYIVLSRRELSGDNQPMIRHEKAHIHLCHSFDRILFDIFTSVFWFNPLAWLFRREIQSVHEYQADRQVLDWGIDSIEYQLLLIRKSVGEYKFALASNFRQRDLHKRIIMMKKNKTNKKMNWNYVMVLPVFLFSLVVLSVPKLNAKAVEKKNDKTDIANEAIAFPERMESNEVMDDQSKVMVSGILKEYKTMEYHVEKAKDNLIIVLEPDEVKSGKKGTADSLGSDLKVIGIEKPENSQGNPQRVVLRGIGGKHPLYILDGKTISEVELQEVTPDNIESISILKDKAAIDMYGDDGKDGVILIETKKNKREIIVIGSGLTDSLRGDAKELIGKIERHSSKVPELRFKSQDQMKENFPLIIVDGEKMPKDFKLNSIDPNEIESISVLKDKTAVDSYGDEGKNGVVIITKKDSPTN